MQVYYTCDNEGPALMHLDELIDNFEASKTNFSLQDICDSLRGQGWYKGVHENGNYLVLALDQLMLRPTPKGYDTLCEMGQQGHCDTGRGVCAHCGKVLA